MPPTNQPIEVTSEQQQLISDLRKQYHCAIDRQMSVEVMAFDSMTEMVAFLRNLLAEGYHDLLVVFAEGRRCT